MGGGQKALLSFAGRPLLDRVLERLRPQVSEVVLNANSDIEYYRDFGHSVVADTLPGHLGPLAGVLAGLRWARERGYSQVLSVAGDTPFFPEVLCKKLELARDSSHPIAMAATPDPERGVSRHPTFAIWPVDLADNLEADLRDGLRKVILWSDRHGCASVSFETVPYDPFFNVNTPADMAEAERMAAEFGL